MRNYSKLIIATIASAFLASTFTILAVNTLGNNQSATESSITTETIQNDNDFIRTSQTRAINTDFTSAAESTVNAVVSIKSFVTPRQRQAQNYFDPFEFFFGQIGRASVRDRV